ncbi:MAG: hypothetical protein WA708_04490 [Acidobacteriaceae bacterium]
MPLKRTEHWATREYHKFLLARAKTPFAWGTNDCCLFPADAIEAFTGVDLASDFRGKYHDEASAFALIKSVANGTTVADAAAYCAAKHGLAERKYPLMAQRGDLVTIENAGSLIAGIVHLNGRHVVSVGASGLLRMPITNVKRAWAV